MILTKLVRTFEIEKKLVLIFNNVAKCTYIIVKHISKFPEKYNIYARNLISLFQPGKANLYINTSKKSRAEAG